MHLSLSCIYIVKMSTTQFKYVQQSQYLHSRNPGSRMIWSGSAPTPSVCVLWCLFWMHFITSKPRRDAASGRHL